MYKSLPKEYLKIWVENRLPCHDLIGDLPFREKYIYRGIPFKLHFREPDNKKDYYWLEFEFWTPDEQWESLGELNLKTDDGSHWQKNIRKLLDPIFDTLIGKGKQLVWGKK